MDKDIHNISFIYFYSPYGALATIDYDNKKIFINEPIFDKNYVSTK